jgi:pyridoxamine 5'-phosphate oxidase
MSVIDTASRSDGQVPMQPEHYHDLGAVQREAFSMIGSGVADPRHAFHTPVLATNGADGFPAARTVVLRGFDLQQRTLIFHTDRRSTKVAELSADPRVAVVFYDAKVKIQLRAAGTAAVHTGDDVSKAAWERLSAWSRRCYLGAPPGTPSHDPTSGLPADLEHREPLPTEADEGASNLVVVRMQMSRLDWLYLAAHGHRRAALTWGDDDFMRAEWLTP